MKIIQLIKQNYWFLLIILLAIAMRFYLLGHVPISPDWDEVSLGYNAYSVLHTGRDEYGKFLPVIMESTGDFKPALYAYLAIPSIAMFGLNVFAVRLPSAIFGVIAIIATYYLAQELFKRKSISLFSALFMAISPWAVQFSRVAIEASVGDCFNILVALFFLKGLKKPYFLFLSAMFAALNLYVYQSEKGFTPMLLLVLISIYAKQLFAISKRTIAAVVIVGLLITLPTVLFILQNHNALTRLESVNVFTESFHLLIPNSKEMLQDKQHHNFIGELVDNRRFVFLNLILANYASHFDPNWWFIKGDYTDRHQPPDMGHLFLWDFPFLFIGMYMVLFGKFDRKAKYMLIGWFLITPIPAAITIDVPHAVRTLNFLPTFSVFTAIGFVTSVFWVRDRFSLTYTKLYVGICSFLLIWNFLFYLDQYFVQFNYFTSQDWQYGYTQLIPYVKQQEAHYNKIIVSSDIPLDQSYIFFLFYLKYPPQLYQPIAEKAGHYTADHAYGKFIFRKVTSAELQHPVKGDLYIIGYYDYTGAANVVKTIKFLNGTEAIKVIKG